ncbi:uncharacterized protein ARMOST_21502 [Armillaria ostoyae]|uniref:Uncharacterized protein n=1 Tax=Armillaria ostoyae TaxID=47428 RepID=A0A284SAA3_ARMOS|nr:uncharacterized protein ARMOST_21502 [Armillaria ostoyae]
MPNSSRPSYDIPFSSQWYLMSTFFNTYQANLHAIAINIIRYPMFCLIFQIMPEIMPQWESVALTSYHKAFMSIILLETDSESEDIDHEENQSATPSAEDTLPTAAPNLDRIVPIYSRETAEASLTGINPRTPVPPSQHKNSGSVRFQEASAGLSTSDQKNALPLSTARPQGFQHSILELSEENVPHNFTRWPDIDLSDPAPFTVYIPLKTQPEPEARRGIYDGVVFTALSRFPGSWNGLPSGLFAMDVTLEDFKQTKKLQVIWETRSNGGDPDGSETASTIRDGKISNRRCLGVLGCENPDCKVVCHPGTSLGVWDKQLEQPCCCRYELKHFDCPSLSYPIQWSGGYRYINGQPHNHSCLSYVLHMTRSEEVGFQALVAPAWLVSLE